MGLIYWAHVWWYPLVFSQMSTSAFSDREGWRGRPNCLPIEWMMGCELGVMGQQFRPTNWLVSMMNGGDPAWMSIRVWLERMNNSSAFTDIAYGCCPALSDALPRAPTSYNQVSDTRLRFIPDASQPISCCNGHWYWSFLAVSSQTIKTHPR